MELRYPYYYKEFKCTAGDCTDSCCMHWEIDIDDASLEKYESWPGEFGNRLRESIYKNEEGGHFKMDADERCVFLNKDGLCEMILNMGEEHLCHICTEHPRYYSQFSTCEEVGVGLCCEAAAKLILDDTISDKLVSEGALKFRKGDEDEWEEDEEFLFDERDALLKDKNLMDADWVKDWEGAFYKTKTIKRLTELMLEFEIISPKWEEMLTTLSEDVDNVLANRKAFVENYPQTKKQYLRLMHYFIYRYYMRARFDEDPELGADDMLQLALISVGTIQLMDVLHWMNTGDFTFEDQVNICKLYSQEIEYDETNVFELQDFYVG